MRPRSLRIVLVVLFPAIRGFAPPPSPVVVRRQSSCRELLPLLGRSSTRSSSSLFVINQENTRHDDSSNDVRKGGGGGSTHVRMQVFRFLNLPAVEVASTMAVLLSSFLVVIDTLQNLPETIIPGMHPVDSHLVIAATIGALNVLFAVDFFVRWYAAGNFKAQYLTKPLVVLDIVVILIPLFVATILPGLELLFGPDNATAAWKSAFLQFDSTGLQNLLLLRILRLRRVLTDVNTFGRFQKALGVRPNDVRPYQLQLARVLLSIFTLLSVASGLIYTAEKGVNPAIPDYFAALYFGLTTLTTVGFGDIAPVTSEGRIIVCLAILAGVAVIPVQAANLVDAVLEFSRERKKGGPRVTVSAPGSAATTINENPDESTSTNDGADETNNENQVSSTGLRESTVPTRVEKVDDDDVRKIKVVGELGRCCVQCEATDHREDALYCWSCGSLL